MLEGIKIGKKEIINILNDYCLYYKSSDISNVILENALKKDLMQTEEKQKKSKQEKPPVQKIKIDDNKKTSKTIKPKSEKKEVSKPNIVNTIKKKITEVKQQKIKLSKDIEKKERVAHQKQDTIKRVPNQNRKETSDRKIKVHFINVKKVAGEKKVIKRKTKKNLSAILLESNPIISNDKTKEKKGNNSLSMNSIVLQKKEDKKPKEKIIEPVGKRKQESKIIMPRNKETRKDIQLKIQELEVKMKEGKNTSSNTASPSKKENDTNKQEQKKPSEIKSNSNSIGGIVQHQTSQKLGNNKPRPNSLYYIVQLKRHHQEVTVVQRNRDSSVKKQEDIPRENKAPKVSPVEKKEHVVYINKDIKKKSEIKDPKIKNSTKNIDMEVSEETEKEEDFKNEDNQTIVYAVISPTSEILYNQRITNTEPLTVESLLLQSGLDINITDGFINSICGISNEGMSGWVFEVNNAPVMVSANQYIVNPSDQITWKYIDFSEMMGSEENNTQAKKTISKK